MVHHGIRSKEVRHARKNNITQTISHSSPLLTHQGDVSCKLNLPFLLVDLFNFNFCCWGMFRERDIYIVLIQEMCDEKGMIEQI